MTRPRCGVVRGFRMSQYYRIMKDATQKWLPSALEDPLAAFDDLHFEDIRPDGPMHQGKLGITYAAQKLLTSIFTDIRTFDRLNDVCRAVVIIPLMPSDRIQTWKPKSLEEAVNATEPPSLILMRVDRLFEHFHEEYFRSFEPSSEFPNVVSFFRSYRYLSGPGAIREFGNGFFFTVTG